MRNSDASTADRRRARRFSTALLLGAVLFVLGAPAQAQQSQDDRLRDALRRALQDRQAIEQQLALLQQQAATAQAELAKAQATLKAREATLKTTTARVDKLEKDNEAMLQREQTLSKTLESTSGELETTSAELTKTQQELRVTRQERADLQAKSEALSTDVDTAKGLVRSCEAANAALYDVAGEILEKYQNKGLGAVLAQGEPFTGLKRVQIENIVQDLKDKLIEARYRSTP